MAHKTRKQKTRVRSLVLFVARHGAGSRDLADPRLLLGAVGVGALGAPHEQLRADPRPLGEVLRDDVGHGVDEGWRVFSSHILDLDLGASIYGVRTEGGQKLPQFCGQTVHKIRKRGDVICGSPPCV